MSVFRINKTEQYTVMSNTHLRDKNLTLKAKGLMSVMLSLPDDWDYSVDGLCTITNTGKDAIRAALQELETNKYLIRERMTDELGRFFYVYNIFEKPCIDEPNADSPHTENPYTEKPQQQNNNILNTNIQNTEELLSKKENIKEKKSAQKQEKKSLQKPTKQDFEDMILDKHFSKTIEDKLIEWLDYKEELRDQYKTERGFKSFLTEFSNNLNSYGEKKICDLITHCMGKEYKGIIYDLLKNDRVGKFKTIDGQKMPKYKTLD